MNSYGFRSPVFEFLAAGSGLLGTPLGVKEAWRSLEFPSQGRAEFEARQLVALGRTSSLYHVHERAVAPWLDASRQQGSLAARFSPELSR